MFVFFFEILEDTSNPLPGYQFVKCHLALMSKWKTCEGKRDRLLEDILQMLQRGKQGDHSRSWPIL